ncbi:MAG: hypothetical protein IH960_08500 [Chloroflexi bacterium]|nr:hypothetical protein [Chloroflexota bacterium]
MSRPVLCAVALFLTIASAACGSDSGAGGVASSGDVNEFGFETSIIASPDRVYTIDDVKTTGWKSSKELPAESLQGVSAVWFGFYQQKNLEVWIYESHEEAKRLGTAPAEEIVAATRGVSGGGAGPYMKQTTHFGAFGVIGNLVVLCETDVAVCENLANALP